MKRAKLSEYFDAWIKAGIDSTLAEEVVDVICSVKQNNGNASIKSPNGDSYPHRNIRFVLSPKPTFARIYSSTTTNARIWNGITPYYRIPLEDLPDRVSVNEDDFGEVEVDVEAFGEVEVDIEA